MTNYCCRCLKLQASIESTSQKQHSKTLSMLLNNSFLFLCYCFIFDKGYCEIRKELRDLVQYKI